MLAWSLEALAAARTVTSVVVAAPPGHEDEVEAVLSAFVGGRGDEAARLHARVVAGGASRSESVSSALDLVAADATVVAVHDAARPLVTAELVDALVEELASRGDAAGVIAAAPLTDTVKRAREPRDPGAEAPADAHTVAATESRDHLWAAQTPQVFRAPALREALGADPRRLAAATDDAMLVEEAGGTVLMHEAPAENLKVTTPLDLRLAEALLADRAR